MMDVNKKKKVLIILSEHGFWGEELIGPMESFDKAGYEVKFATPKGKRPGALPSSMDSNCIDPALGRNVTSKIMADKVKAMDKSSRLDKPLSIFTIMPETPYFSSSSLISDLEAYYKAREKIKTDVLAKFDALLIVGGTGALVDLANNQRVHDIILAFLSMGLPIGAECYGVACLAFARELENRKSIIWGKHVTGPCKEYEQHDGTRFMGTDFNMGPPPYPLEYILRDATGPDGAYVGNFGRETSVIVDHPFITGRSMQDSYLVGQKMVEDPGKRPKTLRLVAVAHDRTEQDARDMPLMRCRSAGERGGMPGMWDLTRTPAGTRKPPDTMALISRTMNSTTLSSWRKNSESGMVTGTYGI